MKIDNANLQLFRRDFKNAVKELEAKYGVQIDLQKITYDANSFKATMQVDNLSENGIPAETQFALDNYPDFKKAYLKSFVDGRHTYKVVGYQPGKTYPIECVRDDGKLFSYKWGILKSVTFE